MKNIFIKLWPYFCLLFLVLIFTYPLILNLNIVIPGNEGDAHNYLYYQWWLKESWLGGFNFFSSPLLIYPFGANLALAATTLASNFFVSILDIFLPTVLAFNLFIIIALFLAASGMYLLLVYLFKQRLSAFIGAFTFAFHPYIFSKLADGHYNYAVIYYLPFFFLFLLKATFNKTRPYLPATWAALFLVIGFYTDIYYAFGLLFIFVLYFCFLFLQKERKFWHDLKISLYVVAIFIILILPLLIPMLTALHGGAYPHASISQVAWYSPDIRSFFVPATSNAFVGDYVRLYYQSLGTHEAVIYLGYTAIALLVFALFKRKHWQSPLTLNFLVTASIFFIFFALGPVFYHAGISMIKNGDLLIKLPYQLLYYLPFVKGILVPARFIIFAVFFLSIISAWALKVIGERIKSNSSRFLFFIFIFLILVFEYAAFPLPLASTKVPNFYFKLNQELAPEQAIIDLPFALSTSFYTLGEIKTTSRLQYFQTVHKRPVFGGYVSRVPNDLIDKYLAIPGLSYLMSPSVDFSELELATQKEQVRASFRQLQVAYIIIHPEYYLAINDIKQVELHRTTAYLDYIFGPAKNIDNLIVYDLRSF